MRKILIVFESKTGQTKKIAESIENELHHEGYWVDLATPKKELPFPMESYQAIIVGGPVYASRYPRSLRKWVERHVEQLNKMPSAFFAVCLGILQVDDQKVQDDERKIMADFFLQTGWRPQATQIFAGALAYTQYGWLKKILMKRIAAKAGGSQDTSRDHEYTDWEQVRSFARTVSDHL
jgi:menaquinone-dependent protoporphyrinogen oxidase